MPALVPALALARERRPDLRGEIYGDGPERDEVMRLVGAAGLDDTVKVPGFVSPEAIENALGSAACLVLPSRREGYGLVVVEAAAHGTPSVVVAGVDNAAVELVEDGVNGAVAESVSPSDLADAIVRAVEGGSALRASTAEWFAQHAAELSLAASLDTVLLAYARS